jgi:hypothetical protein
VTEELLVAASIEPDADGDGFGDETQDACPSQAGTQGQCVSNPPPPPPLTLGGAGVSGGKIFYTLSREATVSLALAKRVAGRKVKGRCVKPTRKNRRKKRCQRYAKIKVSFAAAPGAAGTNTLPLPKRNGRKLSRGRYRLRITATLTDGTKATTTVLFRVT